MKKLTFACALILASIGLKVQITTGKDVAVVATDAGKVRGYVHSEIYTYKGIPYAEAARFEAPHKPKPWAGVLPYLMAQFHLYFQLILPIAQLT